MTLSVRAPLFAALVLLLPLPALAQQRALRAEDVYRLQEVRDPQRSPDGRWVAYVVTSADSAKDKNDSDVWMVSWDGRDRVRVTSSPEGESSPRWSPDGRWLAFLSGRQPSEGGEGAQVWLLDRRGGEAQRLTSVKGGVDGYAWSPDGTRLVLVVDEQDDSTGTPAADSSAKPKTPKPIVVDRYRFKRDVAGYLGASRSHLYLFDVAARKATHLAGGAWDYQSPAWSPDGKSIAFVSKQGELDPDRHDDSNVWVMEARPGAAPRRLTAFEGSDEGPLSWSPDGRTIAFLQGIDPKYGAYNLTRVAVVPAAGGPARLLSAGLDRPAAAPAFQPDGSILFLVTDDRSRHLYRVRPAGGAFGAPERVVSGKLVLNGYSGGRDGGVALLAATAAEPAKVAALDPGARAMRELAAHNDWLKGVRLSTVEEVQFKSRDGTDVHGLLHRPAGAPSGARLPTLLRIHGGPYSQDQHEFAFERELFAAHGYAVLAVNYRGSNGRGEKFGTAIWGDWGNLEVQDLLAGVDHVIRMGVADPERLGIGGWSYGGILTDYTIAQTDRFKAATSGAGSALQLSMYGTDQYITQYETEIGPPWKAQDLWIKISYPFFHADRIRTPTLFLVGEKDFNVPASGSEQMYQALRSLGVPTQFVIYPNQFHGITVPSYKVDRLKRYLAWYDRYLLKGGRAAE